MSNNLESQMKDAFEEIVDHIRKAGCKVKCHYDKKTIASGSNGFFDMTPSPHIEVALKGRSFKRAIPLIVHEFCHYRQFLAKTLMEEFNEANELQDRILSGQDVSLKDREFSRKYTQICEYDCDLRAVELLEEWDLNWVKDPKDHVKSANSYNRHIAWQIGGLNGPGSGIFMSNHEDIADVIWPNTKEHRVMSIDEATSPIDEKHKVKIDKWEKSHRRKRRNPHVCGWRRCHKPRRF
jgi:hypothetical protein